MKIEKSFGIATNESEDWQKPPLEECSRTLLANKSNCGGGVIVAMSNDIKCEVVHTMSGGKWDKMHDISRRVYSTDHLSPTIHTCGGGNLEPKIAECIGGIGEKNSNGGTQYYQQDRIYSGDIALAHPANLPSGSYYYTEPTALDEQNGYVRHDGLVGTLTTDGSSHKHNNRIIEGYKIRKLTPKECFRLMGVKDEDFERVAKNQSNSSLYHLAGDSIITNCLMAIFKEML